MKTAPFFSQKKNLALGFRSSSLKESFVERLFISYNYWLSGFRTVEERRSGGRRGFTLETARGERVELASKDIASPVRLNKYGVNLPGLEAAFRNCLKDAAAGGRILLIDELGPMALLSESVREMAASALAGEVPCLVFFRSGAKSFEPTLCGLDNTAVAELDSDEPAVRALTERWLEERIRLLKELK